MSPPEMTEKQVAEFLRNELDRRYATDHLRGYGGFGGLNDDQLDALRTFGMCHIYPEWEARLFQRAAFESLLALLDNPMRLRPLVAAALRSLWRLGRQLPRAVDAGKQVVEAFQATQLLETRVVAAYAAEEHKEDADAALARAVAAVPRDEFERFVKEVTALMRLLADQRLLEAGFVALTEIATAMEKRPDCYSAIERDGMRYALAVMEEGMALFAGLDDAAVSAAIEAIPLVERDWYADLTAR